MKYKLLLGLLTFVASCSLAVAQQDLNQTVQVSREYEARLMTTTKPTLPVRYSDTLNRFKLHFDYKFAERPYRDLYEFTPVHFATYQGAGVVAYPTVFANLSMAYPWLPVADVYFQPNLGERWSLVAYGNHRSFWGKRSTDDRMTNRLGTRVGYAWKGGDVSLGVDFENNFRSFLPDSLSHHFNKLSADLKLRSSKADRKALYYALDIRYTQTRQQMSRPVALLQEAVVEDLVEATAEVGYTFAGDHRVLLGIESVNSFAAENNGLLQFEPRYRYESGRWLVDAGVGLAGMYTTAAHDLELAHIYPDVSAYFEVVYDKLWVYAHLDGENVLNTWSSLFAFNPWLTPGANVLVTQVPVRAKLGAQGVLWNVFTYNIGMSYADIKNRLVATGDMLHPIQYDSYTGKMSAVASLLLKTKNIEAGMELNYSHYLPQSNQGSEPATVTLMAPAWEGNAFVRYNLRERFIFSAEADYRSAVDARMGPEGVVQLPAYLDVEARVSYVYNRKMTFYLNADNLLNAEIQYIPGYREPGINFGLGVCYKF